MLVTHDQEEALSIADQVAVMRQGVLAQVADPITLYRRRRHRHRGVRGGGQLPAGDGVGRRRPLHALGSFPVGPLASGTGPDAVLLVRPEQLLLGEDTVGVAAEVVEIGYHGGEVAVALRLASGERCRRPTWPIRRKPTS